MDRSAEGVRFQRYRLAVISRWPESDAKRTALSAVQAALERELSFAQSRERERLLIA
jgi:hypothetical protein